MNAPVIAVLPFRLVKSPDEHKGLAEALPDEIITSLSRLRWLKIIARGSSFQFASIDTDLDKVREKLSADYAVSGIAEIAGGKLLVSVELSDLCDKAIVWSERFAIKLEGIHEVREEIVTQIVSRIDHHVPLHEAQKIRLRVPNRLSAQRYFSEAVSLDPGFSRAHAGLSHTRWWLLLQNITASSKEEHRLMLTAAEKSVENDSFDPAGHLAMGRALALLKNVNEGIVWIDRAIELCPNYAWAHNQMASYLCHTGPWDKAIEYAHFALSLSPQDPLRYSIYAGLAVSYSNLQNVGEAAKWGRKAAEAPHADLKVMVTGICTVFAAGDHEGSKRIAENIRQTFPHTTIDGVRRANPMLSEGSLKRMMAVMKASGLD